MTLSFSDCLSFSLSFPHYENEEKKDLRPFLKRNKNFHDILLYFCALCAPRKLLIQVEQTLEATYKDGHGNTFDMALITPTETEKTPADFQAALSFNELYKYSPAAQTLADFLKKMPLHKNKDRYWIKAEWLTPPSAHTLFLAQTYLKTAQTKYA